MAPRAAAGWCRERKKPVGSSAVRRISAWTVVAGPKSSSAWSTRWLPKSRRIPPPAARRSARRLEPLERRLEPLDLAESTPRDELLQGEEVGVPAAVLVDAQRDARGLRLGDHLAGVGRGERERLVAHHRHAEPDGLQGHGGVGVRRRRDGDGRDPVRREGLEAVVGADAGVLPRQLGPACCRGGHHPGEVAAGRAGQQGGVEVPPAEAVADESDAHLLCRHGPIVGRAAGTGGRIRPRPAPARGPVPSRPAGPAGWAPRTWRRPWPAPPRPR